jgi:hypothetical protein
LLAMCKLNNTEVLKKFKPEWLVMCNFHHK